jgi:hypothetical protein
MLLRHWRSGLLAGVAGWQRTHLVYPSGKPCFSDDIVQGGYDISAIFSRNRRPSIGQDCIGEAFDEYVVAEQESSRDPPCAL